jgi:parallel beta-helix repeat protein
MNMKKILTLMLWVALQQASLGTTYYVASGGNDASDGLSPLTPYLTIDKINQMTLLPGDSVLFNRGDLFRGMLQISNSGTASALIYIGAYGTGNLPILSGAEVINGWASSQGNQYKAACAICPDQLKQVFINRVRHIPARYPNSGYFPMSNVSTTAFSAANLIQAAGTWDSASIHLRTMHWVIDDFLVKTYTPGHINYTIPAHFYTSYPIQENFGFFLTGKLLALDTAGEWFYDKQSREISLIPSDAASLLSAGAEVSVYQNCIRISNNVKYVMIKDIQMERSLEDLLFMNGTSFITISDCSLFEAGNDGVGGFKDYSTYNSYLTVQNCHIEDACNTGINLTGGTKILLKDNKIKRCGLIAGLGSGSDGGYEGIYCPANSTITGNTVDSVGYTAIHVISNDTVVYNRCSHYGLTKNDCGGVYFWNGSFNYVAHNFTGDGFGNGQGTTFPDRTMINGVYSDDFSHDNIFEFNTSFHNEMGMVLHKGARNKVSNNIFYDNWKSQLYILEGNPHSNNVEVHDNTVNDNVLQCLHPSQRSLRMESEKNNISTMAIFTNNWYCNPYSEDVIEIAYTPGYNNSNYTFRYNSYTLNDWKSANTFDQGGRGAFDSPSSSAQYNLPGADLIQNSDFSSGTGWWWTYGNADFTLVAAAANAQISSASLGGQYQNTQTLKEGNWGTAPIPLVKDHTYLLTYSMAGAKSGGFQATFNYQNAPFTRNMVPTVLNKSFGTQAKKDTVLFMAAATMGSSLIFNSSSDDGNFRMDDLYLYEVNADTSLSKPHTISVLFQNPSSSPLTISTAGKYRTLDGTVLSSDTVLPPFTSMVLKDIAARVNPTGIMKSRSAGQTINIFPNPATDKFSVRESIAGITSEIMIRNIQGTELYHAPYSGGEIMLPAEWSNGVYMVIIQNDNGQSVSRLVICR